MVKIGKSQWEAVRRHGERAYPRECCGVLLGRASGQVKTVHSIVECTNMCADSHRYQIDPRDLVRIQREALAAGLEIIGFYHSHPDHPARWSPADLAEAYWIGCSYVITCVEQGRATQTECFSLAGEGANKRFDDEKISVE